MKYIILAISLTLFTQVQANECTTDRECYLETQYDCVAEQYPFPASFEETVDMLGECDVTIEEYIDWEIEDDYEED